MCVRLLWGNRQITNEGSSSMFATLSRSSVSLAVVVAGGTCLLYLIGTNGRAHPPSGIHLGRSSATKALFFGQLKRSLSQ